MIQEMIFKTVGGVGLFLYGMELLSDGLKKAASQRVRKLLSALTQRRVVAVLMGAFTTCLIQSSSATTVMTVGFVNAGLLTLKQALCVVLGANIGTTFTAFLVSWLAIFKITTYSLPAIGIGFLVRLIGKTQRVRNVGTTLLGFGILFTGISFMKQGFEPLKNSEQVMEAMIWLGQNPLMGVLVGTIITMLLQSSSATIAMVQILAFEGAFGSDWRLVLTIAIPIILGDNIGTTITAEIAAARSSLAARRTARGHTLFNVMGVIYMLPLVWTGAFGTIVEWITPSELSQNTIMIHIFVAHCAFNVFNTLVFLPHIDWLEAIVTKFVRGRREEEITKPVVLEEHLLNTPIFAMDQARREIVRMAGVAKEAVDRAIEGLFENDAKKLASARKREDATDDFQYEITSYLVELSRKELSEELSMELPVLLHTVNDLERVGDHAVNIAEVAERKIDQKLSFGESAQGEADDLKREVDEMFGLIMAALEKNDTEAARSALLNEENLNRMQTDFRRSHVKRMGEGDCSPESGLIFIDLVDNVEKIGDHLTNIAQAVMGGLQWAGAEADT